MSLLVACTAQFEHPRNGNLGFLPKKRCRRGQGRCKAYPKDDASKGCHLTAFIGYKAGEQRWRQRGKERRGGTGREPGFLLWRHRPLQEG
jgi:hypothetical protein